MDPARQQHTAAPPPPPPPSAACGDRVDNDGDGKVDYPADAGCSSISDADERGTNRLVNPGFEIDANANGRPGNWTISTTNTTRFTRSTTLRLAGTCSVRHRATDNASYAVDQAVTGVTAGEAYRFTGSVNVPATTDKLTFSLQCAGSTRLGAAPRR